MKITVVSNPEVVVKRAFFLAYNACGSPMGMGIFQARGGVTEEDIWSNVRSAGDYGIGAAKVMRANSPGDAYGDYVFGRMMKLGIKWDADSVEVRDRAPTRDYQSWCKTYSTYESLIAAAIESLSA